ncbi:MAG TPA: sugar phosphate nucleotidyltransferase [Candidatus Limnocylindria bacterium]|nr:sugar phosphate nucleotidyltransferase [Candidatus Limnocylindria bacterium]
MRSFAALPWALILAGGDGSRLRTLTSQISGDPRPKQFCPIVDGETLLGRTRRRVDLLTRPDQQVVVVSRAHEPYYRDLVQELAPDRLVVQPSNLGTGPGVLYPLLRIQRLAGNVPVAIFPSDHYISDDAAFIEYVRSAQELVERRPGTVVLLGIEAQSPETEYGWIERAPWPLDGELGYPVLRFWEKPGLALAERLLRVGALWNSFVMVGLVDTFLGLIAAGAPELAAAFGPLRTASARREADVAERVYARTPAVNFSDRVLVPAARRLATMRVKDVGWSDWGHPERVAATIRRTGWRPGWLDRVELPAAG